jgi:hypothetical protein
MQDRTTDALYGSYRDMSAAIARWHGFRLTNHWSEPLAVLLIRFDIMRNFPMFATLALASGRSVHSR